MVVTDPIAQQVAANDARIVELRDRMALSVLQARRARVQRPTGADGDGTPGTVATDSDSKRSLIEDIKRQLQSEMGLLPVRLLRQRRESFVQLNASDNFGKSTYATAGYLGDGYFITVKHGVIALDEKVEGEPRRITSISIRYQGKNLPARVVDSGDASVEVHPGDWAIIKVRAKLDLPPLRVDTRYAYEFADPVFRLGNDYSKGIIASTGYVGERTPNGLVTCLTDGHPGASGGGVLDQSGNLVGILVGRMSDDYRLPFLLPLRHTVFCNVPPVHLAGRDG